MSPNRGSGRRGALAAGAAALAVGAGWWAARPPAPTFEPHPSMPGFRRLAAGATSSGGAGRAAGLVGLPGAAAPGVDTARGAVRADPCRALFGGPVPPGVVPVASFSDHACPCCRVLSERLAAMAAGSGGAVRVGWHELPLLGRGSETAARAALAAGRQGAYPAMHARLMRSGFRVMPAYVEAVAREMGLDAPRLPADMTDPSVEAALRRSAALADLFGFPGTPATVVGRTVLLSAIGERALARLVEREGADGPVPACVE